MINYKIFKAYDIRGIYNSQINEEAVFAILKGYFVYLSQKTQNASPKIAISCDMRVSSASLLETAIKALEECGAKIFNLGLSATPTMYYAVRKYKLDGGVQISASHNPKEYNGLKMVIRNGDQIIKIGEKTGLYEIRTLIEHNKINVKAKKGELYNLENVVVDEVKEAYNEITPLNLSSYTVVSDPANSMGILPLNELFSLVKTNHIMINNYLDGTFPAHQADPLQHKTLRQLQDEVVKLKANLGICTDGDADRAMFVDEKGDIIPATLITTLIAREILKDNPAEKILVDIRYIKNVENMVSKFNGKTVYTPVGHALITQQLNQENAIFAGESSGHYYFRNMGGCESTVRVILYILRVLSKENKPISKIIESLKTSVESGEFNFKLDQSLNTKDVIEKIKNTYSTGKLSTLDGIAVSYDNWRFSIRSSNTEPLLRLNVEGDSKELVMKRVMEIKDLILGLGAHLEE